MLFTGGMSRSDIFFPEIEEEFAKNGTVVSRLEDEEYDYTPTLAADMY